MKQLLGILFTSMVLIVEAKGQSDTGVQTADTTVTEKPHRVEKYAEFPGGMMNFYVKYISKKLKYPKDAKKLGIEGIVRIEFIVESTGEIRQESVRVVRGIYASCDSEVVRLIKKSPKWIPGFSSELNKNIAQKIILPIHFRLK
ncbi:energy transducer TonB [Rapidithrix thailandica]|uniref:Energy transducer TonB n=1 Tax=Rapidithrix thailandica TaxID=413964 RepID=A0AAW9SFE0_9BACT